MRRCREIGAGKFSELSNSGVIVGACRVNGAREQSQVSLPSKHANMSRPLLALLVERYASETRRIVDAPALVVHVLARCGFSQVISAIIKPVAIAVIDLYVLWGVKNQSMHGDGFTLRNFNGALHVPRLPGMRLPGEPIPLRKPVEISSIDNSDLILRQWNVSNRLILRLDDNGVRTPRATFHDLTSNEIVRSSRTPSVYPPPYKSAMEIGGTRG